MELSSGSLRNWGYAKTLTKFSRNPTSGGTGQACFKGLGSLAAPTAWLGQACAPGNTDGLLHGQACALRFVPAFQIRSSSSFCLPKRPEGRVTRMARMATSITIIIQ
jgi:hypothetical protein